MKYQTSDFRNGLKVEIDGQPYIMVYFQFVKPGKGTAFHTDQTQEYDLWKCP